MATNTLNFAAQVSEWAREEEARLEAILQTAGETVYNELTEPGGPTPQVTRNMVKSAIASTNEMPIIRPEVEEYPDRSAESIGVILGAELGTTIYIGFQSAYAARVNYGFVGEDSLGRLYNQTGAGFIERIQQRWPEFVAAADTKVSGRFGD